MNRVPSLSPDISIGVMIAWYFFTFSSANPNVARLTFSFVDKTLKRRSFNIRSTKPPTWSLINSSISSTPSWIATPSTLPFLLITRILDSSMSLRTSQMSLNTTLWEWLLCNNLLIFLVLSSNWTLILPVTSFAFIVN